MAKIITKNILSLLEHNDHYAEDINVSSPMIKAWVDLLIEKEPEIEITGAHIVIIEGGWEPSTVLFETDKGVYRVVIPNDNDCSVASILGGKRDPKVEYFASDMREAARKEELDWY